MNQLSLFYNNIAQREAVKEFMILVLKDITIQKVFAGEDVKGMEFANECILATFDKLEEEYGKIEEPIISNSR